MTEERHRLLDISVKVIASAVTLLGLWIGYQQFIVEFERSNRKPFLEMQTKYYIEILESVAKIAHPTNEAERETATRRFWQLYVGTSALVEDPAVEEKINGVSLCLKQDSQCMQFELEAHALGLSQAIRASLAQSWSSGTDTR